MAGFGRLVDSFDDGVVDPVLWPQSYGSPTEAGGRARIPCTTGYAAYWSAASWTLSGAQVAVRIVPPAPGGASSAAVSLLVLSGTSGTDAGFIIDRAQNAMGLYSRQGFADGGALFPVYDPVAHAWLRLREDAGTLHWEASADGATWAVLRSAASPTWAAHSDLSLLIEAHRDSGTADVAELDSLNVSRGGHLAPSAHPLAGPGPLARTGPTMTGG